MSEESERRRQIKEQFGAQADYYLTSPVHARGGSLARLLALVEPRPEWSVLDVATAAGHTALAFAPFVRRVTATDITPEMLPLARRQAAERGLDNVVVEMADAEALPYPAAAFDLVTCRIAPHHFARIERFLAEAHRVLRPGGRLAVADNVVPAGAAGEYINAVEKKRDPSHGRCWSVEEWLAAYAAAGFELLHHETLDKRLVFTAWAGRHDAATRAELRRLFLTAPPAAAAFWQMADGAEGLTFRLQEGILVGKRRRMPNR